MEPAVKSKTWARNRLIRDGIYQAIYEQMKADRSIYLFGEGSHMKIHFDAPYIEKEFPNRVVTLPICVKGDTIILGDGKPIASLVRGNRAFGENGELNEITKTMKRRFRDSLLSIKARYLQPIVCTPEHPIKAVRKRWLTFECGAFRPESNEGRDICPEWIQAKDLTKGDFLFVPRLKAKNPPSPISLLPYIKFKLNRMQVEEIKELHSKKGMAQRELAKRFDVSPSYINMVINQKRGIRRVLEAFPIDEETAWFLGIYVAEGHANKEYVGFSLNKNETDLQRKIREVTLSLGYKCRQYHAGGSDGVVIHISSTILARALVEWCGESALNKQIPDFIMLSSDVIKTAFLRGLLDGDGTLSGNKKSLRTSSKKLALQVQLLVASLGGMMGLSRKGPTTSYLKSEGRFIRQRESWWLEGSSPDIAKIFGHEYRKEPQRNYVLTENFILVPISSVTEESYEGDVFNIETSNNTYLVNNAVVHNCEDGNTNFAVGTSLVGIKPIVDVISSDFLFRTMDSICNTSAKLNHVSADIDKPKTIVIRSEFFLLGPTTGQRTESLFTHIPGLNVALPSNPRDARGLMRTALANAGVTIFFEDRMINDSDTKDSDKDTGTTERIPFGKAKVRRQGRGLTVVSYALALKEVEAVVENHNVDCDLIDPRTLYPLDFDTICDSVSKTGRLLIVEPDVTYAGIGAEIAASVVERSFSALKRPIRRLGAPRTVIPASQGLHKYVMPSRDEILREMRELSN